MRICQPFSRAHRIFSHLGDTRGCPRMRSGEWVEHRDHAIQRQPVLTNLSCKQAKLRRIAFGRSDRILQAKPHSPRQFQLRWSFPLREIDAGLRSKKGSQNKKPPDWVVFLFWARRIKMQLLILA